MTATQATKICFIDLMDSIPASPKSSPAAYAANAPRFENHRPSPLQACAEGGRNNRIAQIAGSCFRKGYQHDDALAVALAANMQFDPPLDESEVIATVQSIANTHHRNRGSNTTQDISPLTPLFSIEEYKAARYFNTEPPPRRWLMVDVIPVGKTCLLVAPGGTGKTMFALQLATSITTGLPFAGIWNVGEPGSVLLLLGEDDDEELHRRICNITKQLAMTASIDAISALGQNLIIKSVVGEDNLLTTTSRHSMEVEFTTRLQRLVLTATGIPNLKLVVIDPASRFRGGDENAAQDVTRFVEACERIAQETGAAVLIIHHTNKGSIGSAEQSQSAARGSSALTDGVRLQMNLTTLDAKSARAQGIQDDMRKRYLSLSITKSNYGPPQQDVILYRGEGGYLSHAHLTPLKLTKKTDLNARIVQLVQKEAAAGRNYSKTAFTEKFSGEKNELGKGNNSVRDAINDLLASRGLVQVNNKIATPASPAKSP